LQSAVALNSDSESEQRSPAAALSSHSLELPDAAIRLLALVDALKRDHVAGEMRRALNGGCTYRKQVVRATVERLNAKCSDTLIAIERGLVREPPLGAWPYTLAKLADTSDGSAPGAAVVAEEQRDERASADDVAAAEAWIEGHPAEQRAIDEHLEHEGIRADDGLAGISYRMVRTSHVVAAWKRSATPAEHAHA
jgi:hypothetical protein